MVERRQVITGRIIQPGKCRLCAKKDVSENEHLCPKCMKKFEAYMLTFPPDIQARWEEIKKDEFEYGRFMWLAFGDREVEK